MISDSAVSSQRGVLVVAASSTYPSALVDRSISSHPKWSIEASLFLMDQAVRILLEACQSRPSRKALSFSNTARSDLCAEEA